MHVITVFYVLRMCCDCLLMGLHPYLGGCANEFGQSWVIQLPLMRAFWCLSCVQADVFVWLC